MGRTFLLLHYATFDPSSGYNNAAHFHKYYSNWFIHEIV